MKIRTRQCGFGGLVGILVMWSLAPACWSDEITGIEETAVRRELARCDHGKLAYLKASNTDALDGFGWSVVPSADGSTMAVGAPWEDSAAAGVGGDQADNSLPDAGAVYVFVRSGSTWRQQAYLKASNPDAADEFGRVLALSADGSTLAIGVPWEASAATGIDGDQADNSAIEAGAVYVFRRSGEAWSQEAYVKSSNGAHYFGWSVALSADGASLAVGAIGDASAATGVGGDQTDTSAPSAGAVYVFERGGAVWSQREYLKASNTGGGDHFGSSVALSADGAVLAVGANYEGSAATGIGGDQADDSMWGAGAVYVFARSGASWTQEAYVKASNPDRLDGFGTRLALSADGATLAVVAEHEASAATGVDGDQADDSAEAAGAIYVFARGGAAWSQQAYLKASNTDAFDMFGRSVALSADGSTLAAGAWSESSAATCSGGDQADNSLAGAGAAYVFARSGAAWSQQAYVKPPITGEFEAFGTGIALSADGEVLVVGAVAEASAATGVGGDQTDDSAYGAGAVYVYR